jgi:uncharacterized protein (DUF433 family)
MNVGCTPALGSGIYTVSDISMILKIPSPKVRYWLNHYWDGILSQNMGSYSWSIGKSKAVNFQTLIEFYVLYLLGESGVRTKNVTLAHRELSEMFDTKYPFAQRHVLNGIKTDGSYVYHVTGDKILSLDGDKHYILGFIAEFFHNIDFGSDHIASRFWPSGRDKCIIVDPQRQFGHPVLGQTNVYPETIYSLYKSGDSIEFIAFTYEMDSQCVLDAINFCQKKVA